MATINTDIAQKIDIIARENNSATINLIISDENNVAFDLSEYTISFKVFDDSENYIEKTNSSGITATIAGGVPDSTGKITISISESDLSIIPGVYKHKLILSKTGETKTWMYGKFKINND
tara:strand:- start:3530 stop:3889 length:360 start_codon:yes stop_codon:yes gene_type:complete